MRCTLKLISLVNGGGSDAGSEHGSFCRNERMRRFSRKPADNFNTNRVDIEIQEVTYTKVEEICLILTRAFCSLFC